MSGQGGARIKDTEKRGQTGASKERDGSGSEGPREIRGGVRPRWPSVRASSTALGEEYTAETTATTTATTTITATNTVTVTTNTAFIAISSVKNSPETLSPQPPIEAGMFTVSISLRLRDVGGAPEPTLVQLDEGPSL